MEIKMKRHTLITIKTLALGSLFQLFALDAIAQDLTITNARIITTPGNIIENGSIVIEDGRISSVSSGNPRQTVGQVIDASGLTAMAGFIDDHKHVRDSDDFEAQMLSLLEAGYTTVLNGGGQAESNLALSNRISSGKYLVLV